MGLRYIERLAVFIDGQHLQRAARALRLDLDYRRLLLMFQQRGYLSRAHYYMPVGSDGTLRPLLDWLSYNGFKVVSRAGQDLSSEQSALAVEIAVDAMQIADTIDHFVLFAGGFEYVRLLQALQQSGRQVSVVSTLHADAGCICDELRRQADQFLELDDMRPIVSREPRGTQSGVNKFGPA